MGLEVIVGLVTSIIGRIWPDKSEQQKLQFAKELQQAMIDANLATGQMDINTEEAKSSNVFVAGWRPFIGWICGLAFAWQYFLSPMFTYLLVVSGHPVPEMPKLDMGEMLPVLFGMLGLGGLRTYEKTKGR